MNPMLVLLTWMLFTMMVPLTVGVILGRLNRQDVYLGDAAIPPDSLIQGSRQSMLCRRNIRQQVVSLKSPFYGCVFFQFSHLPKLGIFTQ